MNAYTMPKNALIIATASGKSFISKLQIMLETNREEDNKAQITIIAWMTSHNKTRLSFTHPSMKHRIPSIQKNVFNKKNDSVYKSMHTGDKSGAE